jgi:hypothetical protein
VVKDFSYRMYGRRDSVQWPYKLHMYYVLSLASCTSLEIFNSTLETLKEVKNSVIPKYWKLYVRT